MARNVIDILFQVYTLLLFARILSSWVPDWQGHRIIQFISFYTDPYLNLFRRVIPAFGGLDISPIFAFICLSFIRQGVNGMLS